VSAANLNNRRRHRIQVFDDPTGGVVLIRCPGSYQSAVQQNAERIANVRAGQCVQLKRSASLLLPIVQSLQRVAQIKAPVQITDLLAEVRIRHAVRYTHKPGRTGISEEVTIHMRKCRYVLRSERAHHRTKAGIAHSLPPPARTVCFRGEWLVLNGASVGFAYASQDFCIVAGIIAMCCKASRHIVKIEADVSSICAITVPAKSPNIDIDRQ